MKLRELMQDGERKLWEDKGYLLPQFDIKVLREKTYEEPTWLHFGAGNIFRAFPAAALQSTIEQGYDRGVIVAEGFDEEIIERAYRPYDNLSLLVLLKSDGSVEKRVIASVTESLIAAYEQEADWKRLKEIFRKPSLQMVSFTITEKGYGVSEQDIQSEKPRFMMGKLAMLLYERYQAGALPLTLQSMDNCSHNGLRITEGVLAYAEAWLAAGLVPQGFVDYLKDAEKISYPWSMIDKITPRPDPKVQALLQADGFEDYESILTAKNSYTAPFVNAEETEYLVIEDSYTNGRPPLERGGVLYAARETVDKVEKMKVCTCLNPLHTALAIFGCLLGYTLISDEMQDEDLRMLVTKLGYDEAMPVVVDPGILKPADFLDAVLNKRLPNPFMPDAPQRIATDTSQKLAIRFGETIKAYRVQGLDCDKLVLLSLVLAAYARYLKAIDDEGNAFAPSTDPLLEELQAIVAPLELGKDGQDMSCLKTLYARSDVFGVDLYEAGLGERVEQMAAELFAGTGAIRATLHKYVTKQ